MCRVNRVLVSVFILWTFSKMDCKAEETLSPAQQKALDAINALSRAGRAAVFKQFGATQPAPQSKDAAAPELKKEPVEPEKEKDEEKKTQKAAVDALNALSADERAAVFKRFAATQPIAPSKDAAAALKTEPGEAAPTPLKKVVVSADLDVKREQIAPSLGAVAYTIGPRQIETTGQGENAPLSQQLLHVPGVAQDEFGQVHVRGDHGNLLYRINGVRLPEQLGGFGQEIDTRLIDTVSLITGTLPAQFGDRTAGVVDIKTKTGSQLEGGEVSMYGGSYGLIQPSFSYGGTKGKFEYFISTSFKQDNVGIDNTTSSPNPIHDRTDQERGFGYFSYRLDDTSRLTLLLSASNDEFQIPDTKGLQPAFTLAGNPTPNPTSVNERQNEQNYYSAISYQATMDKFSMQLSPFFRSSAIRFTPDPVQDLLFSGIADNVKNSDWSVGFQADTSYELNDSHTLRGGMSITYDNEKLHSNSAVFPTAGQFAADTPVQTSDVPIFVDDKIGNHGTTTSFYMQDEWRLTHSLTMNYGLRYDRFDVNFDHEDLLCPRLNLVWKANEKTTVHAGYARYFVPPTLQFVPPSAVNSFDFTTNAPNSSQDSAEKAERDHYFDAGVSREITKAWQVSADSYYKVARNLIDEGQFGNAVILSDFNYNRGLVYGAELGTTYKQGPLSLYGNFAYIHTGGRLFNSAQYQFGSDEIAYIAGHFIPLDHQSRYSGSAGFSYIFEKDTNFHSDFIYGDGLRNGFANLGKLPPYYTTNVGIEHVFHTGSRKVKLRFDCLNVFDKVYELRDGSGIGIPASAFGQRRGYYGGISFEW